MPFVVFDDWVSTHKAIVLFLIHVDSSVLLGPVPTRLVGIVNPAANLQILTAIFSAVHLISLVECNDTCFVLTL